MALYISAQACTHREVLLRNKPHDMISISPKATVPVLEIKPGAVLEESLEIMLWALERNDPGGWLPPSSGCKKDMLALIQCCESDFKPHLDRYKYANRYDDADPVAHRTEGEKFLNILEHRLVTAPCLFGARLSLADFAIAPFIRQFANTDRGWFDTTPYPALRKWLDDFLHSDIFLAVMRKYPTWNPGDPPVQSAIASS